MIQNIWLRIFPIIKNFYAFSFMYIDRKNWLPILISLLIQNNGTATLPPSQTNNHQVVYPPEWTDMLFE